MRRTVPPSAEIQAEIDSCSVSGWLVIRRRSSEFGRLGARLIIQRAVEEEFDTRHRERWRSTNLLERSLGEVRRRTKVMGRFSGETSCLSPVWAVLDLFFSHASNGATFTDVDRQHLYRISTSKPTETRSTRR